MRGGTTTFLLQEDLCQGLGRCTSSTVLNYKNMVAQKTLYTVFIVVLISTFIIETEEIFLVCFLKLRKENILC